MPSDVQDRFRESHRVWTAKREFFDQLMKRALAGEPIARDDLLRAAEDMRRALDDFMKAGEPLIRWKTV